MCEAHEVVLGLGENLSKLPNSSVCPLGGVHPTQMVEKSVPCEGLFLNHDRCQQTQGIKNTVDSREDSTSSKWFDSG